MPKSSPIGDEDMNRVLAKEIVEAAEGRWGTAQRHIELITLDKVSDEFVSTLKAEFKPLIEEEMVRASKMPKNEFNRYYIGKSIEVSKKMNEGYDTKVVLDTEYRNSCYANCKSKSYIVFKK